MGNFREEDKSAKTRKLPPRENFHVYSNQEDDMIALSSKTIRKINIIVFWSQIIASFIIFDIELLLWYRYTW